MLTPDGRYLIVRGRLWRASNPELTAEERNELTAALMKARRDVGLALRREDNDAEREARRRVDRAKRGLGERGPVWWSDGTPDLNRRMVHNTTYAAWYAEALEWQQAILTMLDERAAGVTICPSEVARRHGGASWRSKMAATREAARELARRGEVLLLQRGTPLDPDTQLRGPIRIARTSDER